MKIKLPLFYLLFLFVLLPFQVMAIQFKHLELNLSTHITTEFIQDNIDLVISPNPAKSTINLYLPKGYENAKLSVFDVLGKEIYHEEVNTLKSIINISKWNSGVYLVRISTDSDSQTKRFVKQ
jgi:hypothetical protein